MSRTSLTTPCPAQTTLNPSHRRISSFELFGDDTANIDYTRAIDQPLTGIKPRRRSMMGGPAGRAAKKAPVTIFEDVVEDEELVVEQKTSVRGKTLLSKPPARIMAQRQQQAGGPGSSLVGIGGGEKDSSSIGRDMGRRDTLGPFKDMRMGDESKPAQRVQPAKVETGLREGTGNGNARKEIGGATIKKNPRRQTIFMPEDTTVMTIHPGANNTSRLDDTFQLPQVSTRAEDKHIALPGPVIRGTKQVIQPPAARRPRQSLALPPKRLPLRESISTENMPGCDVAGANTGKENLPPAGIEQLEKQVKGLKLNGDPKLRGLPPARSSLLAPTAASRHRQSIVPRNHVELGSGSLVAAQPRTMKYIDLRQGQPKTSPTTGRAQISRAAPVVKSTAPATGSMSSRPAYSGLRGTTESRVSPKAQQVTVNNEKKQIRNFIASKRNEAQVAKLKQYPILGGDLSQPGLYEDGWLAYQEVALTEVVNEIFKASAIATDTPATRPLRDQLIDVYNQPEISLLHNRLQASLEYGALAQPKNSVSDHMPLHDIGLRKRLMGLFLDSYNTDALAAAAQVVAGRQIPQVSESMNNGISLDPHSEKRALTAFLETFFVYVADVDTDAQATSEDINLARWRKTMTRGLMLIWLLDEAKTSGAMVESACLFKRASSKKSSAAILDAFTTLLIPAVGDSARALRHMNYEVDHVQDPLDEVVYHIGNIATDLRDGVLLTHLVELLIHRGDGTGELDFIAPEDVSVRLPDGTFLHSEIWAHHDEEQRRRVLSQHLKMPCTSDSQRAYNVQIALSALSGHGVHGNNMVATIDAADLVNGHREKTLSLLWSLVSVYGLSHLVNWSQVQADVARHIGMTPPRARPGQEEDALEEWASVYAIKADVKMRNLTTAFADGKIYAAILNNFSTYLPGGKVTGMGAQLAALGCSKAFADKLTTSIGLIPSYQTTVANLAFLASRLLPLARKHNAAVVFQRAFRKRQQKIITSQRVKLMRMAHDCAKVVQTRNKIIEAATVLQRAWRAVVDSRIRKLNAEVVTFQAVAKGWAARKQVTKTVFAAGW